MCSATSSSRVKPLVRPARKSLVDSSDIETYLTSSNNSSARKNANSTLPRVNANNTTVLNEESLFESNSRNIDNQKMISTYSQRKHHTNIPVRPVRNGNNNENIGPDYQSSNDYIDPNKYFSTLKSFISCLPKKSYF